jgi:hypothetical protein
MEQALPDFAKWAARRHDSYGLGRTPEQVRASYLAITGTLDDAPIAGIDGSLFWLLTFSHLFKQTQYPKPAQTWKALLAGDQAARGPSPVAKETADGTSSPNDNAPTVFLSETVSYVVSRTSRL